MGDAVSSESYTPRQRTTYRRRLEDELERFDRHLQDADSWTTARSGSSSSST